MAEPKKAPQPVMLRQSDMQLSMYARNDWHVVLRDGVTFKQALEPTFWANVAGKMKFGDQIEVQAEDGSFWGVLMVREKGRVWAKVAEIHYREFHAVEDVEIDSDPRFIVKHRGAGKWGVIRLSDKTWLRHDFQSQETAKEWLVGYEKALAPIKAAA